MVAAIASRMISEPRLAFLRGSCIEPSKFFGSQPQGHDLRRLSATAGTTPSPLHQLLDVIARLGLGRPCCDLVLADWGPVDGLVRCHGNNV